MSIPQPIDAIYMVEVQADSTGQWVANGLRFESETKAREYGSDLAMRWTAVREWRVRIDVGRARDYIYDITAKRDRRELPIIPVGAEISRIEAEIQAQSQS